MPKTKPKARTDAVREVHARLFEEDVRWLQRVAKEKGLPWQIELRLTVRAARLANTREVVVLKEQP